MLTLRLHFEVFSPIVQYIKQRIASNPKMQQNLQTNRPEKMTDEIKSHQLVFKGA